MTITESILTGASTGTVGNTLSMNLSDSTTHCYMIIGTITLLFIIGHLLDRKYSYLLYQELELMAEEEA